MAAEFYYPDHERTVDDTEVTPQYQSDLIPGFAGIPDLTARSYDDVDGERSFLGTHDENLFDFNENAAGGLINEETGEPYDNSTYTGMEGLVIEGLDPDFYEEFDDLSDVLDPETADAFLALHREFGAEVISISRKTGQTATDVPDDAELV